MIGLIIGIALVTSQPPARIDIKSRANFDKVEETISYLSRVESYRFRESIIVMTSDKELKTKKFRWRDAAIYWVEEGNTFAIIFHVKTLKKTKRELQFLAAHEVCHGIIHNDRMKAEETLGSKDELDTDYCAFELLTRHKAHIRSIWKER